MKINKLFHWLYFFIMVLPLLAIPIFAIYSHRHTIDNYIVVRSEPRYVNAFQYVINGKPTSEDYWRLEYGSDFYDSANNLFVLSTNSTNSYEEILYGDYALGTFSLSDKIFLSFDFYSSDSSGDLEVSIGTNDNYLIDDTFNDGGTSNYSFVLTSASDEGDLSYCYFSFVTSSQSELGVSNIMIFDLTEIFGSGNEPSADVFKSYLSESYYDYGVHTLYLGNVNVTYNDTDIGSQFTYDVYNVVDKYFNYDCVFNFGDLYTWLNTTFFSGQAPLGFFIFWHLLIYWLLTSILWLVFDVLMYVPQLVHRWLDKASIS